jgi:predicted nuclease of predicted toxin-antitoxin system
MRFLIDNALSPILATLLERAGHNALQVRAIEFHRSDDAMIFDRAAVEDRIVISADTDFGTLLATRSAQKTEHCHVRTVARSCPCAADQRRARTRVSRSPSDTPRLDCR